MSEKPENPMAFPQQNPNCATELEMGGRHGYGMTLRDYFAAKAMQAMFNGYSASSDREAYAVADAMLAEREKGQP